MSVATVASVSTQLDALSTFRGHKPIIRIEDPSDEAARKKLAEHVTGMLKEGLDIFLVSGEEVTGRVKGYDPEKHQWVLYEKSGRPRKSAETRVPAEGTKAAAVARTAGG